MPSPSFVHLLSGLCDPESKAGLQCRVPSAPPQPKPVQGLGAGERDLPGPRGCWRCPLSPAHHGLKVL